MTTVTVYGGINEIGGNKILLEAAGRRIWLDFGMSFKVANDFLDEYLKPKECNGVLDFLKIGLLPELADMSGFYRQDYLAHSNMEVSDSPTYDAIFLSHAHADHFSYVHFVRPDIPIYATEVTKGILQALQDTSQTTFGDYVRFTASFQIRPARTGGGMVRVKADDEGATAPRNFLAVEKMQNRVTLGDVVVDAIPVDHSVPGACGYIVHTPEGAVVYTGDLRTHGYRSERTATFIRKAAEASPIALICEGVRVTESAEEERESLSESDVRDQIRELMAETDGLIVANYPPRDTERLRSFYEAAAGRRKLALSLKQAYLMQLLAGTDADVPALDDPNLCVYVDRKSWGLATRPDWPDNVRKQDYKVWERQFISRGNAVTCREINQNQSDYIVRIDFFDLPDLVDIRPKPGSRYIRSTTEPFDDETVIQQRKTDNWLNLFGLYPYQQVHSSGHCRPGDLIRLIKEISPRILIPVHTTYAEYFEDKLAGTGIEVRLPVAGQPISIP